MSGHQKTPTDRLAQSRQPSNYPQHSGEEPAGVGRARVLPPFKYIYLSKETDFTFNLLSKRLL